MMLRHMELRSYADKIENATLDVIREGSVINFVNTKEQYLLMIRTYLILPVMNKYFNQFYTL